MKPRSERNRRRDQTERLPGHWRHLGPRRDQRPDDNQDEQPEAAEGSV